MRRSWKIILGFALVGLAMAGLSYADAALRDYSKPMNGLDFAMMAASVIFCPAQLIFAACIDCEVVGRDGFIMYSIIGVLNMAMYALLGMIVSLLKRTRRAKS
jgi:hypothetical protein